MAITKPTAKTKRPIKIIKAGVRSKILVAPIDPEQTVSEFPPRCNCGGGGLNGEQFKKKQRKFKEGVSKSGVKWRAWFCKNRVCKPIFFHIRKPYGSKKKML